MGEKCFNCLKDSVIWQNDFSFEDFGKEGEGIVHTFTCMNCGAEIYYFVPLGEKDEEQGQV